MRARLLLLATLLSAASLVIAGLAPPAHAGGVWFDLGARKVDRVLCEDDSTTSETFPADAFGIFPPGSYVWEELREVDCSALPWPDQVCWNAAHIRSFRVEFNDGGCGCGGFVERPSTLRLTYDPAAVAARGLAEGDLRVAFIDPKSRGWRVVEGVLPDLGNHAFDVPWQGDILGVRFYAIVTPVFVAVEPSTWSRLKSFLVTTRD